MYPLDGMDHRVERDVRADDTPLDFFGYVARRDRVPLLEAPTGVPLVL